MVMGLLLVGHMTQVAMFVQGTDEVNSPASKFSSIWTHRSKEIGHSPIPDPPYFDPAHTLSAARQEEMP
jgi:hypothetical protein